ncbi:MAG: AAA family ATPase [Verrucomicrobia bacterium]|nr:AAA family ATPase [Verrucomicrobiota bacterium]MCH8514591.1 ATP-binding protein [Kiritimatiellia bacterium]
MRELNTDLVHIVRLAVAEQTEDVRLYAARMVRRYRSVDPELAAQLEHCLKRSPARGQSPLRREEAPYTASTLPVDSDSRLSLLKSFEMDAKAEEPLLPPDLRLNLLQLVEERKRIRELGAKGLQPTRSAILVGPPGVGKTMTARWLASQMRLPLYALDLTAVMSSLLGRSGGNLRAALDFAKRESCVLLLDEIDAVAKRRSDESDVGELKRLVTVMLQEVEQWPSTGLLLAATNHPELIDPALWRRFDLVVNFPMPEPNAVWKAIRRFLDEDAEKFEIWQDILVKGFTGVSFSDIEREIKRFRRALVLTPISPKELVADLVRRRAAEVDGTSRIDWALELAQADLLSQRTISGITGVSRDTIRKHLKTEKNETKSGKEASV